MGGSVATATLRHLHVPSPPAVQCSVRSAVHYCAPKQLRSSLGALWHPNAANAASLLGAGDQPLAAAGGCCSRCSLLAPVLLHPLWCCPRASSKAVRQAARSNGRRRLSSRPTSTPWCPGGRGREATCS